MQCIVPGMVKRPDVTWRYLILLEITEISYIDLLFFFFYLRLIVIPFVVVRELTKNKKENK